LRKTREVFWFQNTRLEEEPINAVFYLGLTLVLTGLFWALKAISVSYRSTRKRNPDVSTCESLCPCVNTVFLGPDAVPAPVTRS
jgi:hypothetical protein